MHDHHAIRCSGRLISPPTVMEYRTIKWFERYMSEVVASAEGVRRLFQCTVAVVVVSFHPVVGVVGVPCFF
jgi:hypothetical protein